MARGTAGSSLRVRVEPSKAAPKGRGAQVLLAIVESDLQSSVSRGENSGKRLSHTAVVRRLDIIGLVPDAGTFEKEIPVVLDPSWKRENLSAVAFVQERPSGKVLGAGSARSEGPSGRRVPRRTRPRRCRRQQNAHQDERAAGQDPR